jgi:hypothetical protein
MQIIKTSIIISFGVLIFCACENDQRLSETNHEIRKRSFSKVIEYLKSNKIDSVKYWLLDKGEDQQLYYQYRLNTARKVTSNDINNSQIDSVRLIDSSNASGEWVYTYKMDFFDATRQLTGSISMPFIDGNNINPITIYADEIRDTGYFKLEDFE